MNSEVPPEIDWVDWLRRWDAQQQGYVPEREARFAAMFDVLAELLPASFVALDLACGPGSISQRLLARFPAAQVIAVDIDPVMLAIGRGAIGTVDGRLRWIEADLESPGWLQALGDTRVDAALSSTALHWLWPEPLARLYRKLGRVLPPGGVFLNGDHMAFDPALPTFARLSGRITAWLRRPRSGAWRRGLSRGGNGLAGALRPRAAGRALVTGKRAQVVRRRRQQPLRLRPTGPE